MKLICKAILPVLLAAINDLAYAQDSVVRSFFVGETNVPVIEKHFNQYNRSNALFINVHDNERTSVQAAENYLNNSNGLLVKLDNNGARNVSFAFNGKLFLFDPNRMFTQQGRLATLKLLSNPPLPGAEPAIARFADRLLTSYINSSDFIIALHNNTDSNFSILTYQQQQQVKPNTGKVFINPNMDADDFILTTDTVIFNSLQHKNINAVWENINMIEDDGSLSVYAAMHNISYVNIEAEHGHYNQQLDMLNAIKEFLDTVSEDEVKRREKISRTAYLLAPDK